MSARRHSSSCCSSPSPSRPRRRRFFPSPGRECLHGRLPAARLNRRRQTSRPGFRLDRFRWQAPHARSSARNLSRDRQCRRRSPSARLRQFRRCLGQSRKDECLTRVGENRRGLANSFVSGSHASGKIRAGEQPALWRLPQSLPASPYKKQPARVNVTSQPERRPMAATPSDSNKRNVGTRASSSRP